MSSIEAKALTCLKQAEELEGALQNYERAASPRLAKSLQGIGSFLTLLYATLGRPLTGAGRAELATKTTAKRDDAVQSLSWFFVGDLIDWLRDHDRVTGVGRATCELWLSTLQYQKSALFAPCVEAATALGLASVSPLETLRYVSSKVGDSRSWRHRASLRRLRRSRRYRPHAATMSSLRASSGRGITAISFCA